MLLSFGSLAVEIRVGGWIGSVPLTATGLVITTAGAPITHGRRPVTPRVVTSLVLLALLVFVAWGRFG